MLGELLLEFNRIPPVIMFCSNILMVMVMVIFMVMVIVMVVVRLKLKLIPVGSIEL